MAFMRVLTESVTASLPDRVTLSLYLTVYLTESPLSLLPVLTETSLCLYSVGEGGNRGLDTEGPRG